LALIYCEHDLLAHREYTTGFVVIDYFFALIVRVSIAIPIREKDVPYL